MKIDSRVIGLALAAGLVTGVASVVTAVGLAGPAQAATCPAATYGIHDSAPGSGRTVALTFDDGPGRSTGAILSILAAQHVTATFFNLGANEQNNTSLVRAEQRAGYALGDHTWDHKDLSSLDTDGQEHEIDSERSEQASITGRSPCLLRPPYGSYDATTLELAHDRGMAVWNWSVDTEDWKADGSGDQFWVDRITDRANAGGSQDHPVILMHNQPIGNPATVAALPRIIAYYKAHGYRFVDLFGRQLDVPAQPFHYGSTYLTVGQSLRPGQELVSADHLSALQMQTDGDLVLWHTGGGRTARFVLWQSHTRVAGSHLTVEANGDLVIGSPANKRLWHTGTQGRGAHARLTLFSDGNVWLSQPGRVVWQTHTARYRAPRTIGPRPFPAGSSLLAAGHSLTAGHALVAPNRLTELRMAPGGDLQLIRTGDASVPQWVLWSSGTRSAHSRLVLRTNGDLVILSATGHVLWTAHTRDSGSNPRLVLLDTGRALLNAGGRTRWQTHTGYFIA